MNKFETAVLDWIADQSGSPELRDQIAAAKLKKRDFMGTGCFLYLDVPGDLPSVPADVRPVCPHISSSMLMDGAGCSLFLRSGKLHYLEIYARGGFMPEALEEWDLTAAPA